MSATYEALTAYLENEGLVFHRDETKEVVVMTVPCKLRACDFMFHVDNDGKMLDVFVRTGFRVTDEGARPMVLETLMRANCSLRMGTLVMDPEGNIALRASQLVEDKLTRDRLLLTVSALIHGWDTYGTAVLAVWMGNVPPADAIWMAETAA